MKIQNIARSSSEDSVKTMPNSRRRKKQIAANRRQIEKARRRLEGRRAWEEKENRGTLLQECGSSSSALELPVVSSGEENGERGWWDGFYNWCHSGFIQVRVLTSE